MSKLLVVDADPRNGGPSDREELIRRIGPIPDTAEVLTGGGGRHVYFHYDGGPVAKTLAKGVDLKGAGGYVVPPPSIHLSGKRYEVDGLSGAKAFLNIAEIPEWLRERISAPTNGTNGNGHAPPIGEKIPCGRQHDTLVSLAGSMRRRGCDAEEIFALLWTTNINRCEKPGSGAKIRKIAESVCKRYPPGPPSPATTDRSRTGSHSAPEQEFIDSGADAPADDGPRQAHAEAGGWPIPEPIDNELPPVDAFSEDLLPASFRSLVADVTERMQVPMDFPAVVAVLCLAGAVNYRVIMQPKEYDSSWQVVPNLWGAIIADPGLMKSPVIQAATHPLNQIEAEWHREHKEALKDYELERQK